MSSIARNLVLTLVISLTAETPISATPAWSLLTAGTGPNCTHTAFGREALALRLTAALHGRPRVYIAETLRTWGDTATNQYARRVEPTFLSFRKTAPRWLRWSLAMCVPGIAMMAVIEPDEPSMRPVRKIAVLLAELGDISTLRFKPTERDVLKEIQRGELVAAWSAPRRVGLKKRGAMLTTHELPLRAGDDL